MAGAAALLLLACFAFAGDSAYYRVWAARAPVLRVGEAHGLVYACMGAGGIGCYRLDDSGDVQLLEERPDWFVIDVVELEGDRTLLVSRDGAMRQVQWNQSSGRNVEENSWMAEGFPNSARRAGNLLAVAAGGAGVSLWRWGDPAGPPDLIGRYPFVEYAKQLAFLDSQTLLVADTHAAGLLVLDVADPARPRALTFFPVKTYCDSVATDGFNIAVTDRNSQTLLVRFDRAENEVRPVGQISRSAMADPDCIVQQVWMQPGHLLICEGVEGVRHWVESKDDPLGWREKEVLRSPGAAVDARLHGMDSVLVADFGAGIVYFPEAR